MKRSFFFNLPESANAKDQAGRLGEEKTGVEKGLRISLVYVVGDLLCFFAQPQHQQRRAAFGEHLQRRKKAMEH